MRYMTDQRQIEAWKRIALHYAGSESLPALLETKEWKTVYEQKFQLYDGDETKAQDATLAALGKVTEHDITANGWFVESHSWIAKSGDSKGEEQVVTTVLLPGGTQTTIWGLKSEFPAMQPVSVSGLTKVIDHGADEVRVFKNKGAELKLVKSDHDEEPPVFGAALALKDARKPNKNNPKLTVGGKTFNMLVSGHATGDEDHIFINDADSYNPGLSFDIFTPVSENTPQHTVRLNITREAAGEMLGYDPLDADEDAVRADIASLPFFAYGPLDILTTLPDEIANQYADVIAAGIRKNLTTNDKGKKVLGASFKIAEGLTAHAAYEKDGDWFVKVDFEELPNGRASMDIGERTNDYGTFNEGSWARSPNLGSGEPPVPSLGRGFAEALKQETMGTFATQE